MYFQKQDLDCSHYTWDGAPNHFLGEPSRRLFDRFNGEQVLFLINSYGSSADRFSVEKGKKIEHHIYNSLPVEIKSEISVFNWIRDIADFQ